MFISSHMAVHSDEKELMELFSKLDINGDGRLSSIEIKTGF